MKLRNKKTGEVWNVWSFYDGNQTINLKYFNNDGQVNLEYSSLAELNEEWEDYKPVEFPRIMNKKSRNTIRVWATINGFDKVTYEYDVRFGISSFVVGHVAIRFFDCFALLENGKEYTIAELCGEEEECDR